MVAAKTKVRSKTKGEVARVTDQDSPFFMWCGTVVHSDSEYTFVDMSTNFEIGFDSRMGRFMELFLGKPRVIGLRWITFKNSQLD